MLYKMDFREKQNQIEYPNCYIMKMDIDEIREFRDLISWDYVIVEEWTKRKDFKKICKRLLFERLYFFVSDF